MQVAGGCDQVRITSTGYWLLATGYFLSGRIHAEPPQHQEFREILRGQQPH
jgi:hypothetical protein